MPDGRNIYARKGSVRNMPGGESQKGYEEEEDEEELPSSWYLIHRSSTSDDILDAHGRSKLCCASPRPQFKSGTFGLTPFNNHHKWIYYVFYCLSKCVRNAH